MLCLQIACFADQVTEEELEEDFDRPVDARVFAYYRDEMIACAEVFMRDVIYQDEIIRIGGFGPCTKKEYRKRGVGTQICKVAKRYLEAQKCDILFLSVDTDRQSHPLYDRLGFKMLRIPLFM